MDQNLDNKIESQSRIKNLYRENKIKIQIFFVGIFILAISVVFLQIYKEKKINQISEQYIKAGILYAGNEKDKSKEFFEEVLNSKNSFYSSLALYNIIEKDLEKNEDKILEYFNRVEKLQKDKDQKDILKFKKALFLLQKTKNQKEKKLLRELIDSNSKIKNLAEEILVN